MNVVGARDVSGIDITFVNNEVLYRPPQHAQLQYLLIETPNCKILAAKPGCIWVEFPDSFANAINNIDVEFVSRQSTSLSDYFERMASYRPSILPTVRGQRKVCQVHLRSYTKMGGGAPSPGVIVKMLLSANYNRTGLLWNAMAVNVPNQEVRGAVGVEEEVEVEVEAEADMDPDLQECLLNAVEVIKI